MINFRRTGGTIGRELAIDFDLANMPSNVAQRLQNLLLESNFFEIPMVNDLLAKSDEYEYSISVVAGNSLHTVHASDTSMPKPLRPLIEELTELARATQADNS